ncbi:MAG: ABC transporter permease [Acidimicrobiales bacterium]|jgi:ABC-2 type transport system permease protein
MRIARETSLLFWRYSVQLLRNPVWLVVGLSTPLLYLALFTPLLRHLSGSPTLGGRSVIQEFLPGILALLAYASGSGPGFSTIFELQAGFVERLRVTPASRLSLLLGPLLSGMVAMFVFDGVLVAVGAAFGFRIHLGGLAVLAVLLGLLMCTVAAFSIAVALVTKDISSFAALINGLNLPVLLLGGVLLPVSLGPTWMRVIAHFNPLYYLVAASRTLSQGTYSGSATWQAFAVLVPLCAFTLAWATAVYRQAVA